MALLTTHDALARARAIHELQLQVGFTLRCEGKTLGYALAAEFVEAGAWTTLATYKPLLLLSSVRTKLLDVQGMAIATSMLTHAQLAAVIASAKESVDFPLSPVVAPSFAADLVTLAKQSGVIPAILWFADATPFSDSLIIDEAALRHTAPIACIRGETVALPLEHATNTTLTSFREKHSNSVHLALLIGDVTQNIPPLVRVHSSCVTGDLLGSLRCDCGNQLQQSLAQMKEQGSGVLLYLNQEGRGIGITSKLRAYALQEHGLDTYVANEQLGFAEDERDFGVASEMLRALGIMRIRLLTNNPDKLGSFDQSGISIAERVPLMIPSNAHNHAYLEAKKIKQGHLS